MATGHPEEYLPNAFIQAVAYRGTERNAMYQMDAENIVGPLDEQVIRACKFVQRNMRIMAYKDPGRVDVPQYSLFAVFEAVVDAVARDYSIYGSKIRLQMFDDRLDLYSPGAIPNTMTIESMPLRQYSRNELLTSLLARCTIQPEHLAYSGRATMMDKRGEGVPIILNESWKLSHKMPKYQLVEDELLLTIYPADQPVPYPEKR